MPKTIVLVACVKTKSNHAQPASKLYISPLFKKTSKYAQQIGDRWYILSAKYGLLDPNEVIEPYEKTLKNMRIAAKRSWAKDVIEKLKNVVSPGDEIVFLAGNDYREYLVETLQDLGCKISIPMEGLTFGPQLSWLKKQLDEPANLISDGQIDNIKLAKKTISQISRDKGAQMSQAERIRDHVIQKYIEPARKSGRNTVKVTAKDVHTALGLNSRYPNVCNALDGDKFKARARIIIRTRSGPKQSSTVSWVYEILR